MSSGQSRPLGRNETFVPIGLQKFLVRLEEAKTTDEVWTHMLNLYAGLGLETVDYVCATDFRDWEQAQFIRTTNKSRWIEYARQNLEVRKTSYFRTHAAKALTPIVVGLAYLEEQGEVSPERLEIMKFSVTTGLNAGIGIPLRMNEPGQAGILIVGGTMSRIEFDAILKEHGWTIHAAALSAHTRYIEFFKSEFIDRNRLTGKQKELLTLIGCGMMDREIAEHLSISISAVRQRLTVLQNRTGAQNRAGLASLATRIGLIPDPLLKPHGEDLTIFLSTGDGKSGREFISDKAHGSSGE